MQVMCFYVNCKRSECFEPELAAKPAAWFCFGAGGYSSGFRPGSQNASAGIFRSKECHEFDGIAAPPERICRDVPVKSGTI